MVLQGRIELPTSPLPRECSTTELLQHRGRGISGNRHSAQALSGRFFLVPVTSVAWSRNQATKQGKSALTPAKIGSKPR